MFSASDRTILRDLARRAAEIGRLPVMDERRRLWRAHNALRPERPMVLFFPEGAWQEMLPGSAMRCEDARARSWEWDLRARIYGFEHFDTDNVVEPEWLVGRAISNTGWGLEARHHPSTTARGAWAFDPVITRPADLDRLHFPQVAVDDDATHRAEEEACDLFGGILDVKVKGVAHIGFHLMNLWTGWRGLQQTMEDMVEDPAFVHAAMAFMEEGHRGLVRQYVDLNLLSLNNDNTYQNSGGVGYIDDLPAPGFNPERVRPADMWASAETQEFAQVSPRMHVEFALEYERRLLDGFGLTGYGCCEPLDGKLVDVLTLPNIRRVSIAPMANVDVCAERMGSRAIFSWKPDPSVLIGAFDEAKVRAQIRHTLEAARGCVVEMILKDTHTCENRPERFDRWAVIAREEIARALG